MQIMLDIREKKENGALDVGIPRYFLFIEGIHVPFMQFFQLNMLENIFLIFFNSLLNISLAYLFNEF